MTTGIAASARASQAATRPPRRRVRPRIFVVRYSLPCDPPVGGHSCNGGMIPRFHRAVCDNFTLGGLPKITPARQGVAHAGGSLALEDRRPRFVGLLWIFVRERPESSGRESF